MRDREGYRDECEYCGSVVAEGKLMDTFAHAAWSYLLFHRLGDWKWVIFFCAGPDILSFGPRQISGERSAGGKVLFGHDVLDRRYVSPEAV